MPLAEQRGGGELMLLQLIEHGRRRGIDWTVVFFSDGPMVQAVRDWGVTTYIVSTGRLRQPHRLIRAIWRLRKLIYDTQTDVVLSWMGKAQLYGGTAAMLAGVSAVWYQLGLPDPPCWQDRIATLLPAKAVLTCSDTATRAQAKLKPHRPTFTVHPGVDLSRFDPSELPTPEECRKRLGLPITGPIIGIVGRLQRWKGMHYLIEALPTVLDQYPNAHAVIVGGRHAFEPDYVAFLTSQVRALGLEANVTFAGLQSNVPEWMQAMDIVVHASAAEPFGIVVIEAMALGKPTIATATAGPTEIITAGINGMLWTHGNVPSLSEAIILVLADSDSGSVKLGKAAAKRAAQFDIEHYVTKLVSHVYKCAL